MPKKLQFHLGQTTYLFTFKVGFFLLCLFFTLLFCLLGTWQLYRYHYKQTLLMTYEQQLKSKPQPFSQLNLLKEPPQFQLVTVKGRYVNELTMLIQNRVYKDQMGVEVLTPVSIEGEKKLLLVNRGWIPAQESTRIQQALGTQPITGYIKLLNEHPFILGQNIYNPTAHPLIMQRIEIAELEKITHHSFYPFILRLDAKEPDGFIRDWVISTSVPERHLGYAIQWFMMAFVLLIAYLCFCGERIKKRES